MELVMSCYSTVSCFSFLASGHCSTLVIITSESYPKFGGNKETFLVILVTLSYSVWSDISIVVLACMPTQIHPQPSWQKPEFYLKIYGFMFFGNDNFVLTAYGVFLSFINSATFYKKTATVDCICFNDLGVLVLMTRSPTDLQHLCCKAINK